MYEALKDYIKDSELRIVNDNFRIRMSPEIAKNYDNGVYDNAIAEHTTCINEILALELHKPLDKKPIVYTYLVPDDRLQELLMMDCSLRMVQPRIHLLWMLPRLLRNMSIIFTNMCI